MHDIFNSEMHKKMEIIYLTVITEMFPSKPFKYEAP